jgi:hypothetical protein
MCPVSAQQTIKLCGNPQAGGLFAAGGTGATVAGVGDVFNVQATGTLAAILFDVSDAGAAGQHFGDDFNFDIAQTAGVEERSPALIGRKKFFKRSGVKSDNMGQIKLQSSAGG